MVTLWPVKVCRERFKYVEVVEGVESSPHNTVMFLVGKDKDMQELRELQMPNAFPGYSGGKLLGRSQAEGGREGKE